MGTIQINRTKVGAVPGALADGELYIDQLNGKLYWANAAGAVQSSSCISISTFATSATTDTTNAANITSGQLASARGGFPTGSLIMTPIYATPAGFIYCNGAAVSRTTYAALFAVIGTTFGVGDGATTFNVPDYRGVFLRGLDDGKGYDAARAIATYQADAYPSHTHSVTDPGHTHSIANALQSGAAAGFYPGAGVSGAVISATGAATTGITLGSAGSGAETRPKNWSIIFCIKT